MPQIMGSGAAFADFNGDGRLDLLAIDGEPPPGTPGCRLLQQSPDGRFVDVTSESGLHNPGFGMGLAAGDVDNDGDVDLVVTNAGADRLFLSNGQGKFHDATEGSGLNNTRWGTAAVLFDYDRDGWLDLFIANYLDYFPGSVCTDAAGVRDYCGPQSFEGTAPLLLHNRGLADGPRFEDVTLAAGLAATRHKGLGAVCRDFDGDGRPDIFQANDMEPNCLWLQTDPGVFRNEALLRGVAVNLQGAAEANMGVVCDDLNGDGRDDLFITHLRGETNTFWAGESAGLFTDRTAAAGLGPPSLAQTGFGVVAADLEHDGDLDLLVANGRVKRDPFQPRHSTPEAGDWRDYAEPNQIYLNGGTGRFQEYREPCSFTAAVETSRGMAAGDVDNDGDLDFLVSSAAAPLRLYRNDWPKSGHWLMVRAYDPALHRDALGAEITVHCGERRLRRGVHPSASYLSGHDARVHFGLGSQDQFDGVTIRWPSGEPELERFDGGAADRHLTLEHGSGRAEHRTP